MDRHFYFNDYPGAARTMWFAGVELTHGEVTELAEPIPDDHKWLANGWLRRVDSPDYEPEPITDLGLAWADFTPSGLAKLAGRCGLSTAGTAADVRERIHDAGFRAPSEMLGVEAVLEETDDAEHPLSVLDLEHITAAGLALLCERMGLPSDGSRGDLEARLIEAMA